MGGGSAADGVGAAGGAGAAGKVGGGAGMGAVAPLGTFAIASTARGNCALDASGAVQCWGSSPNVWPVPAGAFVELHASIDAMCAIRADRTVACFDPPDGSVSGITSVAPTGKVRSLALQRGALCGVDDSGQVFCNSAYTELKAPAGEMFSQVSVGVHLACGIRVADDSVTCWGFAGDAACSVQIPAAGQLMAPAGAFAGISSGFYSTCGLDKTGAVSCWGAGKATDDATAMCMGSPYNLGQAAAPPGAFLSVAVGANHSCGVKTDGTVACWGAGTADVGCPDTGVDCRQSRPPAGTFAQVSVGNLHSCAITADRKVQCWGYPGADAGDGRLVPPMVFQ